LVGVVFIWVVRATVFGWGGFSVSGNGDVGLLFLFGNTFFVDGNTYILVTLFLILVTLKVGEEKNAHTRRLPNIVRYHTRLHHNNNILGHLS
jgi:hypothetical protein